jgi:hypothetical protein
MASITIYLTVQQVAARLGISKGLCCTNRLMSGLPLSPDRPIP